MFELRLQIGLYDQNLALKKEDFRLKSDWIGAYFCVFFCVRYKVFSVYCTLSRPKKSSVKKKVLRLKWDLMWPKQFLICLKLKFNSIQFGSICFFKFFSCWCLCHFFFFITPKAYFFLWTIYIRLC